MFKGVKNAAKMVSSANKAKKQQEKLQKLLSSVKVTGNSKNEKVSVVITGDQKIQKITIDPALISFVYENFTSQGKEDSMMSKSIIEAVDDAIGKVQGEVVKKVQESGSMGDLMGMLQAASGM